MLKKLLIALVFLTVSTVVAVGLAYIPNLDTPTKRQVIVTDPAVIIKFELCGNTEELHANADLRHFCKGVK